MDMVTLGMSIDTRDTDRAITRTRAFTGEVQRSGREVSRATALMNRGWRSVQSNLALTVVSMLGVRAGLNVLREFESSMASVAAVSRATATELDAMRQIAKDLGSTTEFTAAQAANGMRFLAMAGFEASEAIKAIPDVLDLATAASLDLATAADISSNIMSAFSVKAEDASDVTDALAAVSARANTNVQQLGDAMKFVGPVASAMGLSINETAAAMGVLSDNGLQGSMAGTGLRRVLSGLVNPTNEAVEALEALGLNMEQLDPTTVALTDIIDLLANSGLDAADALTIFGDRGGPAILALTNSTGRLRELTKEMENVEGAASDMADIMRDNLDGDIQSLISAAQGLIIALGEAGLTQVLRTLVQGLTAAVRGVTALVNAFASLPGAIARIAGLSNSQYVLADAAEQAATAIQQEIAKANELTSGMVQTRVMSIDVANTKLEQAKAHLAVVDAMRQEAVETVANSQQMALLDQQIATARRQLDLYKQSWEAGATSDEEYSEEIMILTSNLRDATSMQQHLLDVAGALSPEYLAARRTVDELEAAIAEAEGGMVDLDGATSDAGGTAETLAELANGISFDNATMSAQRLAAQLGISLSLAQRMVALGAQGGEEVGRGAAGPGGPSLMKPGQLDLNTLLNAPLPEAPSTGLGGGGGRAGGESEATKAANELKEEGIRLTQSLRTEQELYNAAMLKNNELLAAGAITTETFQRSQEDLDRQMAEAKYGEAIQSVETLSAGLIEAARNGDSLGAALINMLAQMAVQWLSAAIAAKAADILSGGILSASMGATGGPGGLGALIPGFANGTNNAPGGMAMVGERGPELVNLPKGSKVIPNDRISGHMKQAAPQVNMNQKTVNVLDPSIVGDFVNTVEGEELIMNVISRNQ